MVCGHPFTQQLWVDIGHCFFAVQDERRWVFWQQGEEVGGCGVAQLCVCYCSSIPEETHFLGNQAEEGAL